MNLVIANIGQGIAREIRIKADPDFKLEKKKGENMFNEYSFLELDLLKVQDTTLDLSDDLREPL